MRAMSAWWECDMCDMCDTWLDFLGPHLVGAAEWQRRREIPQERKALLVLTGLALLGTLLALGLAVAPQSIYGAGVYAANALRAALCLLFGFYGPLALLAIFVGTLMN